MANRLIPDNFYLFQAHGCSRNEDGVSGNYIWGHPSGTSNALYRLDPATKAGLSASHYDFPAAFKVGTVYSTTFGLYAINYDVGTVAGGVYHSADGGTTWTLVHSMAAGHFVLQGINNPMAEVVVNGVNKILIPEYNIHSNSGVDSAAGNGVAMWESSDGVNFTKVVDFVVDGGTAWCRHGHSIQQFVDNGPIVGCMGDSDAGSILWEWDGTSPWPDDSAGIDPAVLAVTSGFSCLHGSQRYRLSDVVECDGYRYGASDTDLSSGPTKYSEVGIWRFKEGLTDYERVNDDIGLPREATITCSAALAGDTVTINGLTYTAVSGATVIANREFSVAGINADDATELASCISDSTYGVPGVTVSTTSNVVELKITNQLYTGNTITATTSNQTRLALDFQGRTGWAGFVTEKNDVMFCTYLASTLGLTDFSSSIYQGKNTEFTRVGVYFAEYLKTLHVVKFFRFGTTYFFSGKNWPRGKPGGSTATGSCLASFTLGGTFDEERPDIVYPVDWVSDSIGSDTYNGWYPDTLLGGTNGPKKTAKGILESSYITYGFRVHVLDAVVSNETLMDWSAKAVRVGEPGDPVQITGDGVGVSSITLGAANTGTNTLTFTLDNHSIDLSDIWIKTEKSASCIVGPTLTNSHIYGRDSIIGQLDTTTATRTIYKQNGVVQFRRSIIAAPVSATNTKIGLANYGNNVEYHVDGCVFVGGYAGVKADNYTLDVLDLTNCTFIAYYLAGFWGNSSAVVTSYELTNLIGQSNEGGTTYLFRTQNAPTWTVTSCYSPEGYLGGTITGINTSTPIGWKSLPAVGTLTDADLLTIFNKIGLKETSQLKGSGSSANITVDINKRYFKGTPGAYEIEDTAHNNGMFGGFSSFGRL